MKQIKYNWSEWYKLNNRYLLSKLIQNKSGVWVIRNNSKNIVYIGNSKNLKKRIIKDFLGSGKHSSRDRMLNDKINLNELEFKFAYTEEYKFLKRILLEKYKKIYKKLPKYVKIIH